MYVCVLNIWVTRLKDFYVVIVLSKNKKQWGRGKKKIREFSESGGY